jgi:hypothetical protein
VSNRTFRQELKATLDFEAKLEPRLLVHVGPVSVYGDEKPSMTSARLRGSRRFQVNLRKNQWDIGNVGFGAGIGAIVGHVPGAIVGGVVMFVWGEWRWRHPS